MAVAMKAAVDEAAAVLVARLSPMAVAVVPQATGTIRNRSSLEVEVELEDLATVLVLSCQAGAVVSMVPLMTWTSAASA